MYNIGKIFSNHISIHGLMNGIHKEHKELGNKEKNTRQ